MARKGKKNQHLEDEKLSEVIREHNSNNKQNVLDKMRINSKPQTPNQSILVEEIKTKDFITVSGPPGTGKTYSAIMECLRLLKEKDNKYKKIILVKSVTPLKGEAVGFIKGDLSEKISNYFQNMTDVVSEIVSRGICETLIEQGYIELQPLAFIRGRNLSNSLVIVDEMQNLSIDVALSILTRVSSTSKIIALGDSKQIDLIDKKQSSLDRIMVKFEKYPKIFGVVRFTKEDQMRNPIINLIDDLFDEIKDEIAKNK